VALAQVIAQEHFTAFCYESLEFYMYSTGLGYGPVAGFYEHSTKPLGSKKCREFFDQHSNYYPPWSWEPSVTTSTIQEKHISSNGQKFQYLSEPN
jgi:hypothetical protein